MEKQYLVDWDVWNAQTQTYVDEGLCDWVYTDDEADAVELMVDYIIENSDDWDIEQDGDILKCHHERYDRHNDRVISQDLEYRNFRVRPTE